MYDPMTVAFEIKYPWRKYGRRAKTPWERGYRSPFITIWHVDPEIPGRGSRTDDSCGWFRPPTTKEEREKVRKIGEEQWRDIFRQRAIVAEGDPERYAHVCYEPSAYDAVYWAWRRIKREDTKHIWQYGRERNYLSQGELEAIYSLAASPVNNLRITVSGVQNAEDCADFFMTVYGAYRRHHRPWYRHPRWHVWHWKLQIHPLQQLKRGLIDRCAGCGKRFGFGRVAMGEWSGKRIWHDECYPHTSGKPVAPDAAQNVFVPAPPSTDAAPDAPTTLH